MNPYLDAYGRVEPRPYGTCRGGAALIGGTMRRTKEATVRPLMLCCVLLAVLCAGCGSTRAGRETAVVANVQAYELKNAAGKASARGVQHGMLLIELDRAEQQWQSLGVRYYRMVVSKGFVFGGPQTMTITVRDGWVERCSSPNMRCSPTEESAGDFTIPALFATARKHAQDPDREISQITFDPIYRFPNMFGSVVDPVDPKQVFTDTGFVINVFEFAVLP